MTALCGLLILVSFLVAFPATLAARGVGRRMNALDGAGVKGQIKAAARKVPNTGGVGIFLAIVLPMLVGLAFLITAPDQLLSNLDPQLSLYRDGARQQAASAVILLAGVAILHVMGLFDDRKPLGPMLKLLVMLGVAGLVVALTDSRLLTLLDAPSGGRWLSILVTVLWIVVVTNAFNFLDNMDGLSAGVGALCASFFLARPWFPPLRNGSSPRRWRCSSARSSDFSSSTSHGPCGATIFMGDSGSLVVGFLLAVLSVRITYLPSHPLMSTSSHVHMLLTPLIILAIPLYDFCSVCLIRHSQGKSPFVGDLQHFSHRLVRHGLSRRAAVLVIYGCTAITGIAAISLPKLEPWQAVLVGVQTLLVLSVLALYEWSRTPSRAG